jgi:NADH-quinone oxidoreductase subunit C
LTEGFYDSITTGLQGLYARAWNSHGMLVLDLAPESLLPVVERLKAEFGCSLFLDVTAVDWLGRREPRFDLVYHFMSPAARRRVRLRLQLPETAFEVPTLTTHYGSARFMEREAHEMYGVRFTGNADLRPILLYEGFEGHPLRKDYPMEQEQPIVPYRM